MRGPYLMAAVEGQVVAVERIEHDKECFHGGLPLRCILQTVQIIVGRSKLIKGRWDRSLCAPCKMGRSAYVLLEKTTPDREAKA